MLEAIRDFFARKLDPGLVRDSDEDEDDSGKTAADSVALAVCALLLELAHADDEFTDEERLHIEEALVRHFDLEPDAVQELMSLAQQELTNSVDLFQFTRMIAERYDLGQKMVLAEVMWRVVYADGELAKHESHLMRKISHLLGLKPGYLADARKRAVGDID